MVYDHPECIEMKLLKATEKYNWDDITFLVNLQQINKFEKQNPIISVNVTTIGRFALNDLWRRRRQTPPPWGSPDNHTSKDSS